MNTHNKHTMNLEEQFKKETNKEALKLYVVREVGFNTDYVEWLEKKLPINSVFVSEMRTRNEITRLIELVYKIEKEQRNKCVDMKLRDIVNTSFYRLKKKFDK